MKRALLARVSVVAGATLWLFLVTFNYYIAHKPFGLENALALLSSLGDLAIAFAIYAVAAAVGKRFLSDWTFASPLEQFVLGTGLGLGIISFVTFALGLLGLVNSLLFWLLLITAAAILRRELTSVWRDLRAIRVPILSRFERILALFCGFALALAFLLSLTPATAWDALQYHLVGPQLAMAQGRISPPPDNLSLSNPALVESLFLAAMVLKGDIATQLVHLGFLALTIGLVLSFAQRFFSVRVGWLAISLLLATPSLLLVATWAYNDMALMFYASAALFLILSEPAALEVRTLILAGIFAGLAMGEKYTAGFVVFACCILVLLPRRGRLARVIAFLIPAALVAAPWYLRNLLFVGNPIYPFIWGGTFWDSFRSAWYSRFGTGMLAQPLRLLIVPWEASIGGSETSVDYQATIGPLLLALLPFGLLVFRSKGNRSAAAPGLWLYSGVLYLAWLAGLAQSKLLFQTRLLFPAFPALALLAADGFDRLAALEVPQFSIQRFAGLVIALVLGLTAFSYGISFAADHPLGFLTGSESRSEYLARHLNDYYSLAQVVNTRLPRNARILFLWETRSYYFERNVTADAILDRFAHLRYQYRDAEGIAAYLNREGYTHLILHRAGLDYMLRTGYDPISTEDLQTLQDLTEHYLKQVYGTQPLQLEVRQSSPALIQATEEPYAIYEIVGGNTVGK